MEFVHHQVHACKIDKSSWWYSFENNQWKTLYISTLLLIEWHSYQDSNWHSQYEHCKNKHCKYFLKRKSFGHEERSDCNRKRNVMQKDACCNNEWLCNFVIHTDWKTVNNGVQNHRYAERVYWLEWFFLLIFFFLPGLFFHQLHVLFLFIFQSIVFVFYQLLLYIF